ncbi:hypothetical protein AXG93_3911s1000 [Marchantia polymorpha subsp. ruderalis]|uniref:Uncharacterized protein n=1 Tax=Marchantia polymorpha subsp. ruderalis TaxID=1480154 RepID=A0A176W2Y0_MARPO|nr:hypothetical protein AXG93_3911s1000 [Marchantia polymorpha subsp. ruderalis]
MSVVQSLRRAAAPLRSCAARYLGGAAPCGRKFAVDVAALDLKATQCFLPRMFSADSDSGILSHPEVGVTFLLRFADVAGGGFPSVAPSSQVVAIPLPRSSGLEKISARVANAPKFMFKSDLLWFLKGCNLRPEDMTIMYDLRYRPKYVQVDFTSVESFRLAQRTLAMKGRLGGRYLKLTREDPMMDDINLGLKQFRGRSLLMQKIPGALVTEDVERFFSGFVLDGNFPVKFLRTLTAGGKRSPVGPSKNEYELRALVRFRNESEALRALREKQGSFCMEKAVDLRFME